MAAAPAALALAACVLLLSLQPLPRAEALTQPTIPFPGQGYLPEGTRLSIALNIHLERILSIGEREQNWRALHWFHLQWPDAQAEAALLEATQLWADDVARGTSSQASAACSFACDSSGNLEAGCCDRWGTVSPLPPCTLPHCAAKYSLHALTPPLQAAASPDRDAQHAGLCDPGPPAKVEDLGAEWHERWTAVV